MDKFNDVKEYFVNLDFEFVSDSEMLDNVYTEINGYEEKLILNIDTVYNFEILIKKSNIDQIINLCKNINLHFLSLKKSGSKFCEIILECIDDFLSKNKLEKVQINFIEHSILNIFDINIKEFCIDKNGTHVLRKYFEIIYKKNNNLSIKKDYKSIVIDILSDDISIDTLITIIYYLKNNYSKKVSRIIIKKYLVEDNLKNKMYSYIFEDLIKISDKNTLSIVFDKINLQFIDYVNDKYAIFFILSFINKYPEENDFYYNFCEKNMKNNNFILKVLENYCKLKNTKKIKKMFKEFYEIEDEFFKNILLGRTDTPDTKYINLICLLMNLDILRVNKDFIKYFEKNWIFKKYGISLVKGFLEGGADNKLKGEFVKNYNLGGSLNKKKEGKTILNLIKTYRKY